MPNQNTGVEWPSRPNTRARWSGQRRWWVAASTPSGTPSSAPISMARVASSTVAGSTRARSAVTGLPVNKAWPKSPCSRPPR